MRLVILLHRYDDIDGTPYYMREIGRALAAEGVKIFVARGPQPYVEADLAVQHVGLTLVPDDHIAFIQQYPRSLNGRVRDISKRVISRQLLQRGDDYRGKVIVKANLNCGGQGEWLMAARAGVPPAQRPPFYGNYPVLESIEQVSDDVWQDSTRVVERFLPEVSDGQYCVRLWKFLGDAETHTLSYSNDPVSKGRSAVRRVEGGTVPQQLRELREELGFDFGKFDYGMVDGEPVLYDVNTTPTFSRPLPEEMPRILAFAWALRKMARK